MDEIYEGDRESCMDANQLLTQPENLRPILERLLSANVPEAEAKSLLAPLEAELKRRTCGLVWKREGATTELLKSMGDKLPVFTPCPEMTIIANKGPDHVLVEGENLLALLAMQYTHIGRDRRGLIDVIYIDPPYNTQNLNFPYNDRFPKSEWLTMMDLRLKLAWKLLKDDGVLFVSIDDEYLCECKLMLDDIFGHAPLAIICVEVSKTMGMRINSAKEGNIAKNHEYVLVYVKNEKLGLKDRTVLYDKAGIYDAHFRYFMDGRLEPRSITDVIKENEELSALFKKYDIPVRASEIGKMMTISEPFKKWIYENAENIYQSMDFSPAVPDEVREELKSKAVVRYGKYLLRLTSGNQVEQYGPLSWALQKSDDYRPEFGRVTIRGALWKGFYSDMMNINSEGCVPFKNGKKPKRLIRQLLKWANRPNGVVLDFFAGSGTTLHAVLELNSEDKGNRQCILCTNNELGATLRDEIKKSGNDPDAPEYAKLGVFQAVTWPRVKVILTGEIPPGELSDKKRKKDIYPESYPDNSVFSYKIDGEITRLVSSAQTEQRRLDLMTAHAVSYIALREGFYRSRASKEWSLLWKDENGIVVITAPDMDYDSIIEMDWSKIAGKNVKKLYCDVDREREIKGIMFMPYPRGILDILKDAKRRVVR